MAVSDIRSWIEAATRAAAEGRWQEAGRSWRQVLALQPGHPQALYALGVDAFRRGDLGEALQSLQAAHLSAPGDPVILLSIARVQCERGDVESERRAIEASLAADPYFLQGLLAKAAFLERAGQPKAAMGQYRNALKVAPSEERWPPALREQLLHGQAMTRRFGEEFTSYLAQCLGTRMQSLTDSEAQRWREAGAIAAGASQPYPSVSNQLQVPRLPAIPFFERSRFGWVEAFEAATADITEELQAVIASEQGEFKPYVAYAPGTPVNQWQELNHSKRWSGYALWDNGTPVQAHLARCPRTAAALALVDPPEIDGMCPNAMFSALAPHTHIPPHTGDTNARLVVHLPLVVPEKCTYRVGFEHRQWKVGEVLIFDDSIEHEARNDSDELRVILLFDIWNPLLSQGERDMVRAITAARREFEFK